MMKKTRQVELRKNVVHTHNTEVPVVTHDHHAIDVFDGIG